MSRLSSYKNRWAFILISGLVLIFVGIWILLGPAGAYFSLSIILATGILISGVFHLLSALSASSKLKGRAWLLTGAFVDIGLGIYLLYFPMLTMILLPVILGLWLLFRGFMSVGYALKTGNGENRRWFMPLIPGLVIIVFSFIVLNNPSTGIINIVSWLAFTLIISGIFRIFFSIKIYHSHT